MRSDLNLELVGVTWVNTEDNNDFLSYFFHERFGPPAACDPSMFDENNELMCPADGDVCSFDKITSPSMLGECLQYTKNGKQNYYTFQNDYFLPFTSCY